MAYNERAYFTHFPSQYNQSIRIALLENNYSGSAVELDAESPYFSLDYNEANDLHTPFMASALTAYFRLTEAIFDDLIQAQGEGFKLQMNIGLNTVWEGFVRQGLVERREGLFPTTVAITAVDGIALLENKDFNNTGVEDLDTILTNILSSYDVAFNKTGTNLADGWDSPQLRQVSLDSTKTIFELANIDRSVFYTGDEEDKQLVSQKAFLDHVLTRFNARLFYWGGWKIDSIDAEKSWQTAIDTVPNDFSTDLSVSYIPPIDGANLSYLHKAGQNVFDGSTTDAGVSGFSQTISYNPNGAETLTIDGYVQAQQENIDSYSPNDSYYFDFTLTNGTRSYDYYSGRWKVGVFSTRINIIDPPIIGNIPIRGRYFAQINNIPTDGSTLTLSISAIKSDTVTASISTYNFTATATVESIIEGDTQTVFAQSEDIAYQNVDYGEFFIGDGFGIQTKSAITYRDGDVTLEWRNSNIGISTTYTLNELNLLTLIGYRKSARKVLRGTLLDSNYTADRFITYESDTYKFVGGSFTGDGFWQGTWIQVLWEEPTVTFSEFAENIADFTPIDFISSNRPYFLELDYLQGSVDVQRQNPDFLITWSNIVVYFKDGSAISVNDGEFLYSLDNPEDINNVFIFAYDRQEETIVVVEQEDFLSNYIAVVSNEQVERYVQLWSVNLNINVNGIDNPSAPSVYFEWEPVAKAIFAPKEADKEAALNEVIWDYRNNAIAKLGEDLDGEYTSLNVNASFPVRVNLPQGEHIILESGQELYELTVSEDVEAGALSIPIQSAFILAYQGANIKYAESNTGSQLLVQPSSVLAIAESADANASSALSLTASNGSAIAS